MIKDYLYYQDDWATIYCGDCLEVMAGMKDESVDAIVTDPPYELGFMGKKWDASGIAYNVELWKQALRVLKSGGHLLAFGGTRTYHRMVVAIEDAGFEVRDMLEWVYASGFPKSLNVGKAVDKLQGNEREVVGKMSDLNPRYKTPRGGAEGYGNIISSQTDPDRTKGNSKWEGFGTALKPAHEPIILARKPLSEKTVVENVLKYGTGGIDIDGCRIPFISDKEKEIGGRNKPTTSEKGMYGRQSYFESSTKAMHSEANNLGRFPANIICTDDALNDNEITKGFYRPNCKNKQYNPSNSFGGGQVSAQYNDSGSKSRYFDIDVWAEKYGILQFPKASKTERNEGCEGLELKEIYPQNNSIERKELNSTANKRVQNHHPTVKPVHLMSWLVRLVSKEGDTVLDPFMGSGTTGVACKLLGRKFIGIELGKDHCVIGKARIEGVKRLRQEVFDFRAKPPLTK